MLLLAQYPLSHRDSAAKLRTLEQSARSNDVTVLNLPVPLSVEAAQFIFDGFEGSPQDVLFSGFIPDWQVYARLAQSCAEQGLRLINSMQASCQATEIANWYPLLEDLTAQTTFVKKGQLALPDLQYPQFVKGKVKSKKEDGWEACLVHSKTELQTLASDSDITARQILPLKIGEVRADGFPTAREYRVYLLNHCIVGYGYYWGPTDPWGSLTSQEVDAVEALALRASQRLAAPFVCVDVGQLQDNSWSIIEVGDPQHSGIAHMPHGVFWHCIKTLLD